MEMDSCVFSAFYPPGVTLLLRSEETPEECIFMRACDESPRRPSR